MSPSKVLFITVALSAFACSSSTTNNAGAGGGARGTLYIHLGTGSEIHKLDLGSGAYKKLGFGHGPTVTAEGTIIYEDGNDLVESPEEFTTKRVILESDSDPEKSNNSFGDPTLSPDGTRVAYTTHDGNSYVVDRQSGAIVARFEIQGVTEAFEHTSWTPDGRIVVNGGFGNQGLFISDAALTTMTRFDPNLSYPTHPRVSPDGTKVAFVLQSRVYVIGIDGQNMTRIDPSEDSEDKYPTWSPDGSRVAFFNGGRVNIVPAAGGGPVEDLWVTFPELSDRFLIFGTSNQFDWK